MTHRSRYKGLTIPIGCTDPHHHDEEGYADLGYHLIQTWSLYKFRDSGAGIDHRNPAMLASGPTMSLKNPMRYYDPGKGHTLTFTCSCGEKKHPNAGQLAQIARRLLQEIGPDAFVDIGRL